MNNKQIINTTKINRITLMLFIDNQSSSRVIVPESEVIPKNSVTVFYQDQWRTSRTKLRIRQTTKTMKIRFRHSKRVSTFRELQNDLLRLHLLLFTTNDIVWGKRSKKISEEFNKLSEIISKMITGMFS